MEKQTPNNTISKLDKILIASGFIGPVIFFLTIYFLFPFLYPGFDPVNQTISELGAADSPIKTFTNVLGFSLFGIFIMLFAFGIFRSNRLNRLAKFAAVFFLLTGILMYLVGIFPTDPGGQNYSTLSSIHEKVSNYQFPVLAIGLIIFAISVATHRQLRWLTPVILFLGVVTLILAYYLFFVHDLPYVGILQRFAIGIPYIIMAVIAITLYRTQNV